MRTLAKLLLLLAFLSSVSWAAPTSCASAAIGSPGNQTQSCSLAVTSGDKTIMISLGGGTASPTFTSTSPSLSWTNEVSVHNTFESNYVVVADATTNATGTMTCQVDQGAVHTFWVMFCYDNGPMGAIDVSNTATGNSGNATVSVATTIASDLLFVACQETGGGNFTIATGYTVEQHDYVQSGSVIADKTAGGAGSQSATGNGNPTDWAIILIAYQPPASAVPGGVIGPKGIIGSKGVIGP